ncbi:hypothetical protein GY12_14165 [Micrococcus luteus]|nr:hypothetical protein GY12_14165 [Micrococcus luteus]
MSTDSTTTRPAAASASPRPATAAPATATRPPARGPTGSQRAKRHLARLRRIEQVRGLHRMVDEDVYCIDVLTQVAAVTKALQSLSLNLTSEHLRHCVAEAAVQAEAEGRTELIDEKVAEATAALGRLLR